MLELKNSNWIDLIKTYKELRLLWDPKHEDYSNKVLRQQAYEKVFKKYQLIDGNASMLKFLLYFKKKFDNMRTTYNRERKKIEFYRKKGKKYIPTLWYFKHLRFLDAKLDTAHKRNAQTFFNRYNNKIYLEKSPALKTPFKKRKSINSSESSTPSQLEVKVKSGFIQIGPVQSSEEEDNTENIEPPPSPPSPQTPKKPQHPLVDLLQRQQKFIASVSKLLSTKDQDWQVVGKAIGLQLCSLGPKQRTIAQKLINDAIFFGTTEKLTIETFVDLGERESPVNIEEEHVYFVDPESLD